VCLRLPCSSPPVSVIALLSERDGSPRILRIRCHRRGHCVIEDHPHLDSKARLRRSPMDCLLNELPAEEWSAHQVRSCCKDSWLADGWFCRWCGRDERSGHQKASWGIYGSGYRLTKKTLGWCECEWKFCQRWNYFNWSSCGSCWMVMTHQLVKCFLKLFGPSSWGYLPIDIQQCCDWVVSHIREIAVYYDDPLTRTRENFVAEIPAEFHFCDLTESDFENESVSIDSEPMEAVVPCDESVSSHSEDLNVILAGGHHIRYRRKRRRIRSNSEAE